jgi:hypothetical protein
MENEYTGAGSGQMQAVSFVRAGLSGFKYSGARLQETGF